MGQRGSTEFKRAITGAHAASYANLVEQKWSQMVFKHGLEENPFSPFMGTGNDSMVVVNKDFTKNKGDTMTIHLRYPLTGDGQGDDGQLEGNEEANVFYDQSVVIHERGHATTVNGIMTEQRTSIPLREEGRDSLGEWVGRVNAADLISALSGCSGTMSFVGQVTGALAAPTSGTTYGDLVTTSSGIWTVNPIGYLGGLSSTSVSGLVSQEGGRLFFGGQTTAGVLTTVAKLSALSYTAAVPYLFGTKVISFAKKMAECAVVPTTGATIPPIRPINVGGKKYYVMFIHPWQAQALKNETAWITAQTYAMPRGEDNPLFTGALGVWDGVIIHVSQLITQRASVAAAGSDAAAKYWIPDGTNTCSYSRVARALFCGAQAGVMAWGQMPTWKEKFHDYDYRWGIGTRMIYGVKRVQFNGIDNCIAVNTMITPTGLADSALT